MKIVRDILGAVAAAAVAAGAFAGMVSAQQAKPAPAPALFSDAQAARGDTLYAENCAQCHRFDMTGGDLAPALTGPAFTLRWTGKPLSDLFDYMRTQMPLNSPGGMTAQQNADMLAFLLKKSGYAAGKTDLPATSEALARVKIP